MNVAVSVSAVVPSVYEVSSEKAEPPPVNLKYASVKLLADAVSVIVPEPLSPAALYTIMF